MQGFGGGKSRARLAWPVTALAVMAAAMLAATLLGKDVNWDQLNYHAYLPHALLHGRLERDFFAANIQTYINPLPFLPFYLAVVSGVGSATATAALAALHSLSLVAVMATSALFTRGWREAQRIACALLCVVVAALHPLFIAGLGSSLAEHVAMVALLWGVYCLFALLLTPATIAGNRWWVAAAGACLVVSAVLWKLAMAVMAPACAALAMLVLVMAPDRRALVRGFVGGGVGGLVLGGAWHYWHVFELTGNPFFPFFNHIFKSPLYPSVPVTNDRFIAGGWLEVLLSPLRMLEDRAFVTAEIVVVDPRYLVITVLLVWALVRLASHAARTERPTAPADAMPVGLAALGACVFSVVAYACWTAGLGNGRYALPLHLWAPLAIAALSRWLMDRAWPALLVLAFTAAGQVAGLVLPEGPTSWTREPHSATWTAYEIPAGMQAPGTLYLSFAYADRRSWSALVPQLPRDATFMNVDGYENTQPDRYVGAELLRRIGGHDGPIVAVVERTAAGPLQAERAATWRVGIERQLRSYGLRLAQAGACRPVQDRTLPLPAQEVADMCRLERAAPVDARRERFARVIASMDALEQVYPQWLYPRSPAVFFVGEDICRFYTPQEVYVCANPQVILGRRTAPRHQVLFRHPADLNETLSPAAR